MPDEGELFGPSAAAAEPVVSMIPPLERPIPPA